MKCFKKPRLIINLLVFFVAIASKFEKSSPIFSSFNPFPFLSSVVTKDRNRGYYTVAQTYEVYLRVEKKYFASERSERVKSFFHSKINFICSSQRVIFLLHRYECFENKAKLDETNLQKCLYFAGKTKE